MYILAIYIYICIYAYNGRPYIIKLLLLISLTLALKSQGSGSLTLANSKACFVTVSGMPRALRSLRGDGRVELKRKWKSDK